MKQEFSFSQKVFWFHKTDNKRRRRHNHWTRSWGQEVLTVAPAEGRRVHPARCSAGSRSPCPARHRGRRRGSSWRPSRTPSQHSLGGSLVGVLPGSTCTYGAHTIRLLTAAPHASARMTATATGARARCAMDGLVVVAAATARQCWLG